MTWWRFKKGRQEVFDFLMKCPLKVLINVSAKCPGTYCIRIERSSIYIVHHMHN